MGWQHHSMVFSSIPIPIPIPISVSIPILSLPPKLQVAMTRSPWDVQHP